MSSTNDNKQELGVKFITPIESEFKMENEGEGLKRHIEINSTILSHTFILESDIKKLDLIEIIKAKYLIFNLI